MSSTSPISVTPVTPMSSSSGASLSFSVEQTVREFEPNGWPFTAYVVVTTYRGQAFAVHRRFREFRALHEELVQSCSGLPERFPLWPNVLNRFDPKVIAHRQTGFVRYLSEVMACLKGSPVPHQLRAFLQLPPAEEADPQDSGPLMMQTQLERTDTVILVAFKLPLKVSRTDTGWSAEWDEDSVLNKEALNLPIRAIWVGCISLSVSKEEEDELSELLLEQFNCVVVFLTPQLVDDFYHGFCRSYLRPIFHNHLQLPGDTNPFSEVEWRAYCAVNKKFSEKVMEVYEPGYLTWVHDYHLLLLPSYILRRHRTAHIGLFLHSPFPASDVFRTIAVREELLRAMLNSDLIGFLLFEYTRNFLTCCKRMLGLEYEFKRGGFLGVEYGGRHVMVQVSTFGISATQTRAQLLKEEAAQELRPMDEALSSSPQGAKAGGPVVLAGVDFLDKFKGVELKLLAWEELLNHYPKYRRGHVMVQITVASRNQMKFVKEAHTVRKDIATIAHRINSKYPGAVYVEEKEHFSQAARLLLWLRARVVVYSAIREAVNAHPLEYVVARSIKKLPAGVAVISEFSGFSRVLNGALVFNPWSQSQLQTALDQALGMAPAEMEARSRKDLAHIRSNTSEEWAARFLTDLKSMKKKEEEHWMAVGFGLASFRMIGMGHDFKALDTQQVLIAYRQCAQRAILLDWGGTLMPADTGFYDMREESRYQVPELVLSVLRMLCADPNNHVMILSGLGRDKVSAAFGSVPNLSLAVEHGFHFRIKNGPWQQLLPGADTSWREVAEAIMSVYTTRTSGSYLQKKGSSITWKHEEADPEFGAMQARELQYHLQGVLTAFPVVVRSGKGYVEACPKGVNKGTMAERFLDIAQAGDGKRKGQLLEMILCVGDDSSDELMFSALHNKFGMHATDLALFTATVGRKPSGAASYMGDHTDVVELLKMLTALNTNKNNKRFASMGDLTQLEHNEVVPAAASKITSHSISSLPQTHRTSSMTMAKSSKSINFGDGRDPTSH